MKSANPLPVWGLFGVLLACAITFYLLVPNQKRLLTRLVQDGKSERALKVLHSLSQAERGKDPEFYELMRLRLNRQLLRSNDRAGAIEQVEASLQVAGRFPDNELCLAELMESVSLLNDCAHALKLITPHFTTLPPTARQTLVEALVREALAADMPEVAAQAYENCLQPFPPAETNLVEAVRLWRGAARPERAIRVLENFEQHTGDNRLALGPALAELKFNLLREVDRNREAFDLAASRIGASGSGAAARQEWVQRMQTTAASAPQHRTLLKAYREDAQTNPTNALTWQRIAEIAMAADELDLAKEALQQLMRLKPGDAGIPRQLAQLHEWDSEPNIAFDLYLKLAGQKDAAALERLIVLNPGLYRDRDLMKLLRGLNGTVHQDKHRLLLARLSTRHGEYAEAYSLYQEHLQRNPEDVAVTEEYAQALQRQQAFPEALAAWMNLQQLKPEDESVRGHIAEVHYLMGDFESSLRAYQQLVKRSTDLAVIQKYCTLAESLGELPSLSEALTRQMELKKPAAPEDFIRLAYVSNLLGADAKRQGVLEDGLILFPDNDALRVQLSVVLIEKGQGVRALPVMARSHNLKTNLTALRLYLELLIAGGQYAVAETFLKAGVPEDLLDTQSIVLLQALIHERNQNDKAAERLLQKLYRQHPEELSFALDYLRVLIRLGKAREARTVLQPLLKNPTAEILREASRLHAELGDYKEAERLQARVLKLPSQTTFRDWSYLGDIHYSAGNPSAARRAYRQALVTAEKTLRPPP